MAKQKQSIDATWKCLILGKEWTVVLMTQQQMTDHVNALQPDEPAVQAVKSWGVTFYSRRLILIDVKLLGTPGFKATLGHELVHAMLEMVTQMGKYQEELVCDCLGMQLFDICDALKTLPKGWE